MRNWIVEFMNINRDSASKGEVWDSFKASVRGETICYVAHTKRQQEQQIKELGADLASLEVQHMAQNFASNSSNKDEIASYYTDILAQKYQAHKSLANEYSKAAGRMLAFRTLQRDLKHAIEAVEDGDGTRVNTLEGIMRIFKTYYAEIYAGEVQPSENEVYDFLRAGESVVLDQEEAEWLDAEIALEEVQEAGKMFPSGEAAGPNQIPVEFYITFFLVLAKDFWDLVCWTRKEEVPPTSWQGTNIVVFKKRGKPLVV
ncbi:hypothetical protein NDU88_001906 [Pleurodeles waltl]|uniref:Uncharacterized protein n=1 Tax=Pleurodeles waltl TaxID=8319 RepID=A0AAV7NET4_PLEWA|nr:hypothetical protein NDU88_001906 [Pleurodeles waltl]